MPKVHVIEDASKAHPIGITDPGAVTRFQCGGFHASRMAGHPGTQCRGTWQSPWDWVAVPTAIRCRDPGAGTQRGM